MQHQKLYQKAKYQGNPEVQLVYKKHRYHGNIENKQKYKKNKLPEKSRK